MLIEGASQSRVPRIIGSWWKDNFDLWKLWALEGRPVDVRVGELCIRVFVYLCICVFVTNTCWRESWWTLYLCIRDKYLSTLGSGRWTSGWNPVASQTLPPPSTAWKQLQVDLIVFSNCTMSVVGVIRMSKVNSNLKVGFRSRLKAKIYAVLVWNHIGLDPSIDNGQIYSGHVSKCLAGVCL